jgi:sialate O-acetylesterase
MRLFTEISLPSIFTDHMILQRNRINPIWGKAAPGQSVRVNIADQSHSSKADADGKWLVKLEPMEAGGPFELQIIGSNTISIKDVLIGEVWVCSGQSNMERSLNQINDTVLEAESANHPQIRFLTIPQHGTQEPQDDFEGAWEVCNPHTVKEFSAIGYFFGWRLQQILTVPIGLIDNSWGGSTIEAWIPRQRFMDDPDLAAYLAEWDERLEGYTDATHEQEMAEYEVKRAKYIEDGRVGPCPPQPDNVARSPHRPANIYNGGVHPILGYGIQGMIWYQGEANTGQAERYHKLFPILINTLREQWGQVDFPFYWAQLANCFAQTNDPNEASSWAELREAQTMTQDRVPNAGEVILIDVGEGRDIHPRNKRVPADRFARWALANQYGIDLDYHSPRYESMEVVDNKATLTFTHVQQLYTFGVNKPIGFTIAGEDHQFVWAEAKLTTHNQIEVWSDQIPHPVSVRYGWAQNPEINVYSRSGLPLTPFRTDIPDSLKP